MTARVSESNLNFMNDISDLNMSGFNNNYSYSINENYSDFTNHSYSDFPNLNISGAANRNLSELNLFNVSEFTNHNISEDDIISFSRRSLAAKVFLSLLVGAILLTSVLGNMLVIACIRWSPRLREETGNIFLINLSITDMSSAITVMSGTLLSLIADDWIFSPAWCDIVCMMNYVLIIVSMLTLCFVSLDRYTAVIFALRYYEIVTNKRAMILIGYAWFQGLVFGLAPVLEGWVHYDYWEMVCAIDWSHGRGTIEYVIAAFTLCFVAPGVVLATSYCKVMGVANKHVHPYSNTQGGRRSKDAAREPEDSSLYLRLRKLSPILDPPPGYNTSPGLNGRIPETTTGFNGRIPETTTGFNGHIPETTTGFNGGIPETTTGFNGRIPETTTGFNGRIPETTTGFNGQIKEPISGANRQITDMSPGYNNHITEPTPVVNGYLTYKQSAFNGQCNTTSHHRLDISVIEPRDDKDGGTSVALPAGNGRVLDGRRVSGYDCLNSNSTRYSTERIAGDSDEEETLKQAAKEVYSGCDAVSVSQETKENNEDAYTKQLPRVADVKHISVEESTEHIECVPLDTQEDYLSVEVRQDDDDTDPTTRDSNGDIKKRKSNENNENIEQITSVENADGIELVTRESNGGDELRQNADKSINETEADPDIIIEASLNVKDEHSDIERDTGERNGESEITIEEDDVKTLQTSPNGGAKDIIVTLYYSLSPWRAATNPSDSNQENTRQTRSTKSWFSSCRRCCKRTQLKRAAAVEDKTKANSSRYSSSSKALQSLLIVVLAFFICMTPFCITKLYKVIMLNKQALPGYVNVLATIFQFCSSAINPLIYGIFRKDFRHVFKKYLSKWFRKEHSVTTLESDLSF